MGLKRIANEKIENPFDGTPFQVSWSATCKCGKEQEEHHEKGAAAACLRYEVANKRDMTVADAVRLFLLNAYPARPPEGVKEFATPEIKDCDHIFSILRVLKSFKLAEVALGKDQPEHLDLERDDHEWLVAGLKARGRFLWGPSTSAYVRPVEKAVDYEPAPPAKPAPANGAEDGKRRLERVK